MTGEEKELSEQESLRLIASMIHKAKGGFHETGTSAILWGSAVAIPGFISFAELKWNFYIGFDIWLLTLAAIIPQIFISIREGRRRKAVSHDESVMNAVWTTYGFSIMLLVIYINVMPSVSDQLLRADGVEWLEHNLTTGKTEHLKPYVVGQTSLFLLLYSMPTLVTGIARKFKPMLYGALLCYVLFFVSFFTSFTYDMLLMAVAGIFNWLIPGFILRKKYLKTKGTNV
ncbi:hypothetical protein [Deminuibacter soli]|nr:hypothetical protein [Deminuibacter soli]